MDFRFNAHDARTGAHLFALPRPAKAQIGDVFGDRGTLEVTYSAKQARAMDLPTFVEVRMQVQYDGGDWADVGPALVRLGGSHEDTDQAGMRDVKFVGREWLLGRARVSAGDVNTELIDGKRPFYQASAGEIMRTLILEAKDRGAAAGIELSGFNASKDSAGVAWSERVTIYYSPGLPIGDVLQNLVDQGLCDYRMNGRVLELYEPETTLGRDLTTGSNPVRVHGAVTEAPVTYTLEDLANSALLIGEDNFEIEVDNPSAPDDYGRLEVTIEQGGVNQEGTARTLIDAELQRGSREIREITRTQHAAGAHSLPYRDYRAGDFVQAYDQGEWVRYRVREIQLVLDGDGWTVHTVLNDRLQELLLRLAKKTNGIVNGSRGSGGDGTRPAPPAKPGVEPASPEGLVIDQQVYLDDAGTARGVIEAGWGEVTQSTRGLAIDIGGYELWWRENKTFATWQRATATSGDTSVAHSPVVLTDGDGEPMEYQWRVRAVAQESARPGPFSSIVTLTMTQDTTPPPPPSMPIVETGFRIVTVEWDGLDEDGQVMPRDFAWTRIYLAAAEDMAGARRVGSLGHPGSWNSDTLPADVPVWVAMTAVDRVGNESPMTPAVSVTPRQLVDDEKIREELDGIDDTIRDAVDDLQDAIDNIVVDVHGTTTYQTPYEPDETTDPAPKAGDLWFDTSNNMRLHRHDGQGWVSASDERIQTIQDAQDQLEADIDTVRTGVDGKNRITQSTSTPPSQYDGSVGDRWERMSSMGSGGSLISNWRWNGDVWVSTIISDAVLGNVDAAKIGTGYLDAQRIEAGSITADKLLVGGGQNILTNPRFANSGAGWAPVYSSSISEDEGPTGEAVISYPADDSNRFPYLGSIAQTEGGSRDPRLAVVEPGQQYRARVYVRSSTALPASSVGMGFRARTYGESEIGWGAPSALMNSGSISANTWTLIEGVTEFEGTYNRVAFGLRLLGTVPSNAVVEFSAPSLVPIVGGTLIEDGAITTDKIAVGAITAESAIIESVNAGTITVGEMHGSRIMAGTIAADRVLIGNTTNLIPDPGALGSIHDSWQGYGSGTVGEFGSSAFWRYSATSQGYRGVRVGNAEGAFGSAQWLASSKFQVKPGESYMIEVIGYRSELVGGFPIMGIRLGDANDGYMGETETVTMDGTGFSTYRKIVTIPNDLTIKWGRLRYTIPSSVTSGYAFFFSPVVRPAVGATLIEDGAITTDKITANAITAGKIAALAITADKIAANAVTADTIAVGAIDGKMITGATIRTNATGARVQMTSQGFYAYNTANEQTFNINANNGAVDMTGNLTQRNSYGGLRVGPDLYSGTTDNGPAIGFPVIGTTYGGSGGIYARASAADGKPELHLQGPFTNQDTGSLIDLAAGDSSKSTLVRRSFGENNYSALSLNSSGGIYIRSSSDSRFLAEGGGNIWGIAEGGNVYLDSNSDSNGSVFIRKRNAAGSETRSYVRVDHQGVRAQAVLDITLERSGDVSSRLNLGSSSFSLRADGPSGMRAGIWRNSGASANLVLDSGGDGLYLQGSRLHIPILPTTSDSANIRRISGQLHGVTSSARYKLAIEDATYTVPDLIDRLLSVRPKTWFDKTTAERIAAAKTAEVNGWEEQDDLETAGQLQRIPGVIAEDLHDAGLSLLVEYDDGKPEAVRYDRLGSLLLAVVKDQHDRITSLESMIGATP